MSVRGLLSTVGLVVLVAAGCGVGQAPSPPPTTPAQPSTTARANTSPLARRGEPPPPGVTEQAGFFSGGESGCVGLEDGPPPLRLYLDETTIMSPRKFLLCFPGFAKGRPLTLEAIRPDGTVRRLGGSRYFGGGRFVSVLPGDPFGRYVLRARQDDITASADVTVAPAAEPTVLLVNATAYPRLGRPVRLAVGGFPPNKPARIHAYVRSSLSQASGQYVTSLDVPTDGYGQGMLTIPTRPDDPGGCSGILLPGQRRLVHLFCFASSPPSGEQPAVSPRRTPAAVGAAGAVIFRDDFSSRGRWYQGDGDGAASEYSNEQYRLIMRGSYRGLHFTAPRSRADQAGSVRVEVDATRARGRRAIFGVTCRQNQGGLGVGGFYLGAIDTSGYWIISRFKLATFTYSLAPGVPSLARTLARAERRSQYSSAVRPGLTNRVGLDCRGGTAPGAPVSLLLSVNGYEVSRVQDPRGLGPGPVGLWAESLDEPVEVRFDNFAVSRLGP